MYSVTLYLRKNVKTSIDVWFDNSVEYKWCKIGKRYSIVALTEKSVYELFSFSFSFNFRRYESSVFVSSIHFFSSYKRPSSSRYANEHGDRTTTWSGSRLLHSS